MTERATPGPESSAPKDEEIIAAVARELDLAPHSIGREQSLASDLGLDSLDLVKLVMGLEHAFARKIDDKDAAAVRTIADLLSLVRAAARDPDAGRSMPP